MLIINLRTLLQMSTSQGRPLSGQKRVGHSRYTVRYELQGPKLIIRQVKRVRNQDSRKQRICRHRRKLCRAQSVAAWCCDCSNQTNVDLCNLVDSYSGKDSDLCTPLYNSSQTDVIPCNQVTGCTQTDVELCHTVKGSQTDVDLCKLVNGCSQTDVDLCNLVESCIQTDVNPCSLLNTYSQTDVDLCSLVDACSQTLQPKGRDVHVDTIDLIETPRVLEDSTQSVQRIGVDTHLDTFDLIMKNSKEQQTEVKYFDEKAFQTEQQPTFSEGTQMYMEFKSCSTQVDLYKICLSTQTEPNSNCVEVQTISDGHKNATQTAAAEDEPIQHYESLLISICTTLHGQSLLLQSGVEGINQLVEQQKLKMIIKRQADALELWQKQQEAEQQQSKLQESEQLESEQQESDTQQYQKQVQIEPIGSSHQLRTKLSDGQQRYRIWKYRHSSSWKCKLKCKGCGLHMHRIRYRVVTDCKYTQTDLKPKKICILSCGTQTYKQRKGCWIFNRS